MRLILQEVNSLIKQVEFTYGIIKRMPNPFHLILAEYSETIHAALMKLNADRWYATMMNATILEAFDPHQQVSEIENLLLHFMASSDVVNSVNFWEHRM